MQPTAPGGEALASRSVRPPSLATRSLRPRGLLFLDSASGAVGKASGAFSDPHSTTLNRPVHAAWDLLSVSRLQGRRNAGFSPAPQPQEGSFTPHPQYYR